MKHQNIDDVVIKTAAITLKQLCCCETQAKKCLSYYTDIWAVLELM